MIAACGQMEATTMDRAAEAWTSIERLATRAVEAGADVFVLPEAAYPAYYLESAERYMRPDIDRTEVVLDRTARLAARHAFWVIAGFVEEDGGRLYNSAAVFDRSGGWIGTARKNFLWDCDHRWFSPGGSLSVFDSEFGKLGVLICADARVPEIPATLVNDGARFLVQPTAWVNTSTDRGARRNIQPEFLIRARALEFGVPLVCCSKSGCEGSVLEYVGQSRIVSATGEVLAEAPAIGERIVVAEVAPGGPRQAGLDAASRRRLLGSDPPFRPVRPGGTCTVRLGDDVDAVAARLEAAGARVARLAAADLAQFALARCHALDGAQVLVVDGRAPDEALLRTRAAENRVFVITASNGVESVVDPNGDVSRRPADGGATVSLDLGRADVKRFNPSTDLWAQRRVECYRLSATAPAS